MLHCLVLLFISSIWGLRAEATEPTLSLSLIADETSRSYPSSSSLPEDTVSSQGDFIPPSPVVGASEAIKAEQSWLQRMFDSLAAALEDEEHDITDLLHQSLLNRAILFVAMFFCGRRVLLFLRSQFEVPQPVWKSVLLYSATPILLYGLFYYLFSRVIAEISALGMILGNASLLQPSSETIPSAKRIRLVVKDSTGAARCSLWLENDQVTALEVRDRIAHELDISPSARINIESGKGQFIEDLQKPVLAVLKTNLVATDAFSALTASVIITISDLVECKEVEAKEKAASFFDLINSTEPIKFEADLYMSARVKSTAFDLVAFSISTCNGFAAASPHRHLSISTAGSTLRFLPYVPLSGGESSSSIAVKVERKPNSPFGLKGSKSVVRDKDQVVIECEGKYLSVAKGWWLAWSSDVPRRSGAFVIEITERARKNVAFNSLKSGMKKIKDTILDSKFGNKKELSTTSEKSDTDDNILRAGDSFRLRNLKFPEYELGVTSVKIKDNYCYLGMRKVLQLLKLLKVSLCVRSTTHLPLATSGR